MNLSPTAEANRSLVRASDAKPSSGPALDRPTVSELAQTLVRVHEVRSVPVDQDARGSVDQNSLQAYLRMLSYVGECHIGRFVPEIRRYAEYTQQPHLFENQEMQRTIAAAGNFGNFLVAAQALRESGTDSADFSLAYQRFASTQPTPSRITTEQFATLARFYDPLLDDVDLARAALTAVVYGDLFKLKSFKESIQQLSGIPADGDHDAMLVEAFDPQHLIQLRGLFPSYFATVAPQYRAAFSTAILNGPNLGHIVQYETRAVTLRDVAALVQKCDAALHIWRCGALADISAAWSVPGNAASWSGLIQRPLARALIEFFKASEGLSRKTVQQVADTFEQALFNDPYYKPVDDTLGAKPDLCLLAKRISRFYSCETFNLPAKELAEAVEKLAPADREVLSRIFGTSGLDPQSGPGVVITYLPYLFTQGTLVAFGRERVVEAYRVALQLTAQCYRLALEELPTGRQGLETFNGQNLWFAIKGEVRPGNTTLFENLLIARDGKNFLRKDCATGV